MQNHNLSPAAEAAISYLRDQLRQIAEATNSDIRLSDKLRHTKWPALLPIQDDPIGDSWGHYNTAGALYRLPTLSPPQKIVNWISDGALYEKLIDKKRAWLYVGKLAHGSDSAQIETGIAELIEKGLITTEKGLIDEEVTFYYPHFD